MIALIIPEVDGYVLTASENGFGKRTPVDDFPVKGRGTQGVIAMQSSDRNGGVVGGVQIFAGDELMLISDLGTLVRTPGDDVSVQGRNTQGVRLINLAVTRKLVSVARIVEQDDDDADTSETVIAATEMGKTPRRIDES